MIAASGRPSATGSRQPKLMLFPDRFREARCSPSAARRRARRLGQCEGAKVSASASADVAARVTTLGRASASQKTSASLALSVGSTAKNATPSAARDRRRRRPEQLGIRGLHSRRDIPDCAVGIPRRGRWSSNPANTHMRSASANPNWTWILSQLEWPGGKNCDELCRKLGSKSRKRLAVQEAQIAWRRRRLFCVSPMRKSFHA